MTLRFTKIIQLWQCHGKQINKFPQPPSLQRETHSLNSRRLAFRSWKPSHCLRSPSAVLLASSSESITETLPGGTFHFLQSSADADAAADGPAGGASAIAGRDTRAEIGFGARAEDGKGR